ncbi:MAG: phospholipase A [Rhodocyclales bacterium]|nr:phospholipase A [Rhodocyclales bacterium]
MKRACRSVQSAALAVLSLFAAGAALAAPGWLIATPSETVRIGEAFELEVVRPDSMTRWPETLRVRLQSGGGEEYLELQAVVAPGDASRRTYRARLPKLAEGLLRAGLAELPSNRLALLVRSEPQWDTIERMSAPADTGRSSTDPELAAALRLDPLPEVEPALSANEPMYIVAGSRDGLNSRFQLSFKYRLFDERSLPARLVPSLGHLHFGYTQTSLWDLHGDSKPFRDTSYRPSLFWQGRVGDGSGGGAAPVFLRGGYEHESNGKDGDKSRSIDTLFLQPAWRKDFADGRTLLFAPKFIAYLDRDDNRDIAHYRGYADWMLRYGNENGWVVSARLRRGSSGHGSGQLDFSHPLREPLFSRVGGFLHIQLFSGYGETLLDYNLHRSPQLRIGFSIVR